MTQYVITQFWMATEIEEIMKSETVLFVRRKTTVFDVFMMIA